MRAIRLAAVAVLISVAASAAGTFTVTNTNDSGAGSLRQAISDAASAGGGTIVFNLPSTPAKIMLESVLPDITNLMAIDATTQPGYAGKPLVEIDGSLLPALSVPLNVRGVLKGIAIGNCTYTAVVASGDAIISDNYFGLDATGTIARSNGAGVDVRGGAPTITRNVASGNGYGIMVKSAATVSYNVVGLNAAQTAAVPNGTGIEMEYTTGVSVYGNIVAGNTGDGIDFFYTNNSSVTGNRVGTNASNASFPNGTGIEVYQSSNNIIGGTGSSLNIIANSRSYGIWMSGTSVRNLISRNWIYGNAQLGIELSNYPPDGPTPNDPGDGDSGPNTLQNYPVLTRVTTVGGVTITGSLSSTPNASFTLEFFSNSSCHSSGYGEGKNYLGTASVTTDGSGVAPFNVNFPSAVVTSGMAVTATATDSFNDTSEFSRCAIVEGPGQLGLASGTASVNEGASSITLSVLRVNGSIGTVTVDYATVNGSATVGSDYTATSGTLTFADGETSKSVTIPILNDTVYEGNETFALGLSNPTGGATLGPSASSSITIVDNDPPPIISGADIRVTEGNSGTTPAVFTLNLTPASPAPVTVSWTTSSSSASLSDYQAASGTVTFNPGETQKTVTIQVIGDTVFESDEVFYLYLFSASGAALSRSLIACTIVNDDVPPTISADDVRIAEGDSGTTSAVVTLRASQPIYGYVDYYTLDGTALAGRDYNAVYGSVYFNNETQKQISIPVIGDTDVEPDEQFRLHLSTYYGYALARSDVNVTIVNDDAGVGPATQTVAKGSSGQVIVDAGNAVTSPQTVSIATSDPCIKAPSSVTINAGSHSALISVLAVSAPCSARVDVTLPAALGGKTASAGIRTYVPLELAFDPPFPRVFVGQTITVHVTASAGTAAVLPLAVVGGTAEVPASVTVDAGGGSFTVKGLKPGALTIFLTLPSQNGSGTAILNGEVAAAPTTVTISQLQPASGPTAGGTAVTLSGANFRADCAILFGGIPAVNTAFVSAASMTATTPAHVAGTVEVTALCGSETFTLPNAFTYVGAGPTLAAVSPSFGATTGGTLVRITGSDLRPNCWAFFDDLAAHAVSVSSVTEMSAVTPAHAPATVRLSLRCQGGVEASLADAFSYSIAEEPPPVITSVDPLAAAPGQLVNVVGTRFRSTDRVTFDTVPAEIKVFTPVGNGDTHRVAVPSMPLGKVSINVTDVSGRLSTTGPIFTVLEALTPQVTAVSPTSVPAGGELTIDGNGFRAPYTFALGDAAARTVTMSYTRAIVRVPATLPPGTYELHVVNGSGQIASIGGKVAVTAGGVVVTNASPICATSDGGSTITISGSGFANGAGVTINGVAATNVTVVDATRITATLPPLAPGWATVVVANPGDGSGMATNALRLYSPFDPDGCNVAPRPRPVRH